MLRPSRAKGKVSKGRDEEVREMFYDDSRHTYGKNMVCKQVSRGVAKASSLWGDTTLYGGKASKSCEESSQNGCTNECKS